MGVCTVCMSSECERLEYLFADFNSLPLWNVNNVYSNVDNLPLLIAYSEGKTSASYKI